MQLRTKKTTVTMTCILIQGCDVPLQPGDVVFLYVQDGLQLVDTGLQTTNDLKQHLLFRRHVVNLFPTTVVLLVQETHVFLGHLYTIIQCLEITMNQGPFFHLPEHCQIHMDLGKCMLHLLVGVEVGFLMILNGGSAYGPYDVNQILLTSNLMPAVLLSNPKIRIPYLSHTYSVPDTIYS